MELKFNLMGILTIVSGSCQIILNGIEIKSRKRVQGEMVR